MWSLVEDTLLGDLRRHPEVAQQLTEIEREVLEGRTTAGLAAARLLEAYRNA